MLTAISDSERVLDLGNSYFPWLEDFREESREGTVHIESPDKEKRGALFLSVRTLLDSRIIH